MIVGGGEHSTTRGTTEQNPPGAVHQAAGAGGVASSDWGVTDCVPRGSPHPRGQADRAFRAPPGTPAKGQVLCVQWYLSVYSDICLCTVISVFVYSDICLWTVISFCVQWYMYRSVFLYNDICLCVKWYLLELLFLLFDQWYLSTIYYSLFYPSVLFLDSTILKKMARILSFYII